MTTRDQLFLIVSPEKICHKKTVFLFTPVEGLSPWACRQRGTLGSRRVDFKFSLMIYVEVIRPIGIEKTALANGTIVLNFCGKPAEGNPKEVMAKPKAKEVYLGPEGEPC